MTRLGEIATIITNKYMEDKPTASFVSCVYSGQGTVNEWSYSFFFTERQKRRKSGLSIDTIIPIRCQSLVFLSTGISLHRGTLDYDDKTGLFKVVFSDGSFMYAAKWFAGIGKNRIIESMYGTEEGVWKNFLRISETIRGTKITPKVGVYTVRNTDFGIEYDKFKKIPNNRIFHDVLTKIHNSINYYFSNVSGFMKYNQSGRRSILLYGEPGTSKTSSLYQLAIYHKGTKSVCFFTDMSALMAHVKLCEKYSVPTLVFLEDCDSVLQYNDPEIKGFLSGVHAGKNKGGTCIVYTTNYPDRLEETIIERPERIDEMYYIGPISGNTLIDCANFYFGDHSPTREVLEKVLIKPMTGAEVKLFVENTLKYCAANIVGIDVISMSSVLNNYRKDVKDLKGFIKKAPHKTFVKMAEDGMNTMGFGGMPAVSPVADFNE